MKSSVFLIFLAPTLAIASGPICVDSPCQLFITSGSMTANGESATFSASGPGFTTNGGFNFFFNGTENGPFGFGARNPLSPGDSYQLSFFNACSDGFSMGVNLAGVGFGTSCDTIDQPGGFGEFDTPKFTITGAGTFTAPFSFLGTVVQDSCIPDCSNGGHSPSISVVDVHGSGTVSFDVLPWPYPNQSGFYVDSGVFTFKAPEPSTAALLLLGFAGLAVLGWRNRNAARTC